MNRYGKIPVVSNNNELYKTLLRNRNIKLINQYGTIAYNYPTAEQLQEIDFDTYIWKSGDRYWKLAQQYYSDPSYWWVIGFINKRPIDSDLEIGESIYIPRNIEDIMSLIEG
jgi:hypothetical protein